MAEFQLGRPRELSHRLKGQAVWRQGEPWRCCLWFPISDPGFCLSKAGDERLFPLSYSRYLYSFPPRALNRITQWTHWMRWPRRAPTGKVSGICCGSLRSLSPGARPPPGSMEV